MDRLNWVLGVVNAVSLLLIFIWVAITVPATDMDFYSKEYDKYHIPQSIGVEKPDLMHITDYLVGYMMGKNDNLTVSALVNNERREFFNQREKDHMKDVRDLFTVGKRIFYSAIALFIMSALTLFYICKKPFMVIAKSNLIVSLTFLISVITLTTFISINFEHAFTIFHKIFFNNDLWILDPRTDLLINIVPLPFFIDISITCGCILGIMLVFIIVASNMYLKSSRK